MISSKERGRRHIEEQKNRHKEAHMIEALKQLEAGHKVENVARVRALGPIGA